MKSIRNFIYYLKLFIDHDGAVIGVKENASMFEFSKVLFRT